MNHDTKTKKKVVDAAVKLFNTHGYDGTSVREIAKEAGVNAALISYYFKGKKGLLEDLMSEFLEGYLVEIEAVYLSMEERSVRLSLTLIIDQLLKYQQRNYQVARFVHREMTIDSILVREIMSSYLTKEKFFFYEILSRGMMNKEFVKLSIPFVCMQLRSLLTTPFLNPQYLQEVYQLAPYDPYFLKHYKKLIESWLDNTIIQNKKLESKKIIFTPSIAMET